MNKLEFYTLADLGAKTEKGYEILRVGTMYSRKYGKIVIKQEHLDAIAKNFNDGVLETVPFVDEEHKRTEGSRGPITKVFTEEGKLFIDVGWNSIGLKLIEDKVYMYLSAHIDEAINSKTGKSTPWVLLGAAMTNYPVYKNQNPLYEMTLSETPPSTDKNADESGSNKNNKGGNPMDDFKKALEALSQALAALPDDAAKEQAKKDAVAALGFDYELACGKKTQMSEADIRLAEETKTQLTEVSAKVKTLSEENVKLVSQIKASEFDAKFLGKKVTPANRDKFFELFLLNEKSTSEILDSMPELKLTEEKGKEGGTHDPEFKLTEQQEGVAKQTGYDVTKPEERKRFLENIKK